MRYFSTFSGIGGFEIGIHNAFNQSLSAIEQDGQGRNRSTNEQQDNVLLGHQAPLCVGYSEIDKYASSVYERHFNGHRNYGDITKINEKELPDFDCLVGGFPCQAFSIAGKRRGFEDTRGTLFFDLARILRAKQPRYFVFENVKGLVSHDNGNTFRTIITTIDELGYDCQWAVLNSKNHGVPQNRERIIIVGHLRGTPRPEVFPITGTDGEDTQPKYYAAGINNPSRGYEIRTDGLARSLVSGESGTKNRIYINQLNQPTHSNDRVYGTDGISPTLNTMQGGNRQPFIAEEARIRRLTPIECERLQGFPPDWTKYGKDGELISDTQRYKMCGNAVTTNVIQAVFERIFANE